MDYYTINHIYEWFYYLNNSKSFSNVLELIKIGQSSQGRDLLVLKVEFFNCEETIFEYHYFILIFFIVRFSVYSSKKNKKNVLV
jgi:hypothetical protein